MAWATYTVSARHHTMATDDCLNRRHRGPYDHRSLMCFELVIRDMRRACKEITPAVNSAHVAHQPLRNLAMV